MESIQDIEDRIFADKRELQRRLASSWPTGEYVFGSATKWGENTYVTGLFVRRDNDYVDVAEGIVWRVSDSHFEDAINVVLVPSSLTEKTMYGRVDS